MIDLKELADSVRRSPAAREALREFATALAASGATDEQTENISKLSAELCFTFVAVTLHMVDARTKANRQN